MYIYFILHAFIKKLFNTDGMFFTKLDITILLSSGLVLNVSTNKQGRMIEL